MALRNCTMLHVVAGSCMFRIIVQVASPFGDDSESKTQVNEQKNTLKLLKFRGIGRFVIPLCFQWLATFCNSMTSCALQLIVVGDFAMLTWDYSHSKVDSLLVVQWDFIPWCSVSVVASSFMTLQVEVVKTTSLLLRWLV